MQGYNLFKDALQENDKKHYSLWQELKENESDLTDIADFKEVISEVCEEFHTRFYDFNSLKLKLQLFNNSMNTEVTQRPFDLQMELCDPQSYPVFQSKKKESPEGFAKMLLKRSSSSFEISPVKCCHYLEAPMWVWSSTLHYERNKIKEIALIILLINHASDCLWQEYQLISINLLHKTGSIISLTILV